MTIAVDESRGRTSSGNALTPSPAAMMPPAVAMLRASTTLTGDTSASCIARSVNSRTLLPTDIAMNGSSASAAHVSVRRAASGWCSESTATNRSRSRTSDCNDGAVAGDAMARSAAPDSTALRGFGRGDVEDLDPHARVLGHELDQDRRQVPRRDRRQCREDDAAVVAAAVGGEAVERAIEALQQVAGEVEQLLALRGERHRPGGAGEQRDPERPLELAHRSAHDRLADVQILGGAGERPRAGDGAEHLEVAQALHASRL